LDFAPLSPTTSSRSRPPVRTFEPQRPGDVAAAWLMEFTSANTRQAYATDLAAFFVWCAQRPVDVWAVRRYHFAEYLARAKPRTSRHCPTDIHASASSASWRSSRATSSQARCPAPTPTAAPNASRGLP